MILESLARVSRCHAEFMNLMNRGIPETTDATHSVVAFTGELIQSVLQQKG